MKIAMTHVDLPNESKGGVAFQVHYLANALVKRGHEITMFTFSPAYADCLYQVHQYPISPRLRRYKAFLLAWQTSRTDFSPFDLVHAHGDNYLLRNQHPQLRTFYGSAKDEAETAVSLKRRIYQTIITRLEDIGARVADTNVGISEATRQRVPAVSKIVPCGVDLTHFYPGMKSAEPSLLFVGTTGGRKRGALLAKIFLKQIRHEFPNAQLWAVTEKPMEGEGIVNLGKVSLETLTDLYRRAWVFCLPSSYEGFGVPYIEAMASGTAVVATPNPGALEVLDKGRFGVIADDANIGTQINKLFGDISLRENYARMGLERAQDFSWDQVAGRYEQLYQELTSHHQTSQEVSRHAGQPPMAEGL
jgi:phosphatidylinositol alpha-mannosyltransferase